MKDAPDPLTLHHACVRRAPDQADYAPHRHAAMTSTKINEEHGLGTMPQSTIEIATHGPGLYEFTDRASAFTRSAANGGEGLLTVFVRHTSCSLLIQENADPDVKRDLDAFFARLVPPADSKGMSYLVHRLEGPDDMPAHIKAALTQTSIGIPVNAGALMLGTWQGLYLFEHRTQPHRRQVVLHLSA